ncbi:MAG TPA: L-seryl-tRNA(Sec) selenium transferase, partial [Bacteroidetes bacterium]|nr:L-seryl-tRNA(Sec) selenium transferase [Bacteroidota bacterium]
MTADANARLHRLPAVDRVLAEKPLAAWSGSPLATGAVREELASAREEVRSGGAVPTPGEPAARAAARLDRRFAPRLRRVINGTGIIIHTNLGRAPLGEEAIAAMAEAARGYSTLEFDLPRGRRGSRHTLVQPLLTALTGAEDALVANNNAAALLLALDALSKRKEVIVSRGQLVEIGGSFRIPDICRASGARLREVGTTNRTRLSDYEEAVGARSGVLLRVHPSNYRIIGFTGEVSLAQLVQLGRTRSLPVVDDLGSGALLDISRRAVLPAEPLVAESVAAGATVVTFSGDKLLGGPQAGIAVGQHDAIERMRR